MNRASASRDVWSATCWSASVSGTPDGSIPPNKSDLLNFGLYLEEAAAGDFRLTGSYTWSQRHTRQQYPGDPREDMLDVGFSAATLPRRKGNLGVGWDQGAWGASLFGNYVGRVANYDNDAWTDPPPSP